MEENTGCGPSLDLKWSGKVEVFGLLGTALVDLDFVRRSDNLRQRSQEYAKARNRPTASGS